MEERQKFLEKVADFLLKFTKQELSDTVVVFPNHRSTVFLKNYIREKKSESFWFPEMMTIDDLLVSLSGLTILDPLVIDFELYKIHRNIQGDNARSLDDFLAWAPLIQNDFSEIDYYLADAHKLFGELTAIKALEKWNLGYEPLTDLQKNYIEFFHSLGEYYNQLHDTLIANGKAYKALAYRHLAENILDKISTGLPWKHFVFAGFNALTPAEAAVIKVLKEETIVDYLIDTDRFYYEPGKDKTAHEAGGFIKKALRDLNMRAADWVEDKLLQDKKEIEIVGIPKQMGQAQFAAKKLYEWTTDQKGSHQETAVVLADEGMLMPLLSEVPVVGKDDQPIHYNVTLGYALTESPLHHLIQSWLNLLITQSQSHDKKLPINDLLILLKNQVVEMLHHDGLSDLIDLLKKENSFFISKTLLKDKCTETGTEQLYDLFFHRLDTPKKLLTQSIRLLQVLQENEDSQHRIIGFQIVLLFRVMKILTVTLEEHLERLSFQSLQKILVREMQRQQISLKGEPLSGIQVMGLLETRNLDFENIIILNANEGILPKTGFQDSFIPFDLKRSYGLPLPNNKTAVFSYHLFRLMQRARRVVFTYNTEPDALGGGEPSRFILQMEHELATANPGIKWKNSIIPVDVKGANLNTEINVERSPEVLERLNRLARHGISPSAVNAYINCPLQFYLRYVLKVNIPDNLETSVETSTFGNVIHGVLQKIYSRFKGGYIEPEILKEALKKLDSLLKEQFEIHYGQGELVYGKNRLIFKVAEEYLRRYLEKEIKSKMRRKLVDVEKEMDQALVIDGRNILFKGKIDRVDSLEDDSVQIIDYKTGKVEKRHMTIKDLNQLFSDASFSKALQVLSYAWLYSKKSQKTDVMHAGLISLRATSGAILNVEYEDDNFMNWITDFEAGLIELLREIFSCNQPFRQTTDTSHCTYCDFKRMCNR